MGQIEVCDAKAGDGDGGLEVEIGFSEVCEVRSEVKVGLSEVKIGLSEVKIGLLEVKIGWERGVLVLLS